MLLVVTCSSDATLICRYGHGHGLGAEVPLITMGTLFAIAMTWQPRLTWVAFWASASIHAVVLLAGAHVSLGQVLLHTNWLLLTVVLGRLLEDRKARQRHTLAMVEAAHHRAWSDAHTAMIEERIQIAGDLHDVLAHHIAVVNAQAGVAAHLLDTAPDAARTALTGIEHNSRNALDDLRSTIEILRTPHPTTPRPTGVEHVPDLIASMPDVVDISLQHHGTPRRVTALVDTAAYRIVQEALTNASKHAPHQPVHVDINWQPDSLDITITNPMPPTPTKAPGTGHGRIGMQERADAAHGHLTTGRVNDDWIVRFTCPIARTP